MAAEEEQTFWGENNGGGGDGGWCGGGKGDEGRGGGVLAFFPRCSCPVEQSFGRAWVNLAHPPIAVCRRQREAKEIGGLMLDCLCEGLVE